MSRNTAASPRHVLLTKTQSRDATTGHIRLVCMSVNSIVVTRLMNAESFFLLSYILALGFTLRTIERLTYSIHVPRTLYIRQHPLTPFILHTTDAVPDKLHSTVQI